MYRTVINPVAGAGAGVGVGAVVLRAQIQGGQSSVEEGRPRPMDVAGPN